MKLNDILKDYNISRKKYFLYKFQKNYIYFLCKYIYFLRREEKFSKKNSFFCKILFFIYNAKKNRLGISLGISIPRNVFSSGLIIFHHGSISVHPSAVIGNNCKLHGQNCIGEKDGLAPKIGNNCDIGYGAVIIGNVRLGNNVTIGANSIVTKSFYEDNIVLCGNPARKIKNKV